MIEQKSQSKQALASLILWQVIIHALFVLSALALAFIDRVTFHPPTRTE